MFEKIGSIALVIIAIVLVFGGGYFLGQRSNTDATAVKGVLADMTVHANALERQQIDVKNAIANFSLELRGLKNDDVDKVLRKYGL